MNKPTGRKTGKENTMEEIKTPDNQGGSSTQQTGEKTFSQDDVNRIVQERLAKEKGKQSEELDRRTAELDRRERRMNAIQTLRNNGLPDYLVDALNMDTDEALEESIKAINRLRKESDSDDRVVGRMDMIGRVHATHSSEDKIRDAFGI